MIMDEFSSALLELANVVLSSCCVTGVQLVSQLDSAEVEVLPDEGVAQTHEITEEPVLLGDSGLLAETDVTF